MDVSWTRDFSGTNFLISLILKDHKTFVNKNFFLKKFLAINGTYVVTLAEDYTYRQTGKHVFATSSTKL